MPKIKLYQNINLENGRVLQNPEFEWWSSDDLQSGKPIFWILHALTGNHRPDVWWNDLIGPDKCFDTNKFNIFCANSIGSCYGSTGPSSINPETEAEFGKSFPILTIRDQASAFAALANRLSIAQVHTLIGASIGGQQALELALQLEGRIDKLLLISTNAVHSPWGIAFNETQRMALESGENGLAIARAIAMLSYRTYELYNTSQTRESSERDNFRASSYQRYQGQKLNDRFDALSYWYLSKAMDSHDISRGRESLEKALDTITADTLIIGAASDGLFPFSEQEFLYQHIPNSSLLKIESIYGHDSFLAEQAAISPNIKRFLQQEIMWRNSTIQTALVS